MLIKNVKRLSFVAVVLIPWLLALSYYLILSPDRYLSSAQVVVRQTSGDAAQQMSGLAMLMSAASPVSREETLYLKEHVLSQDMLTALDKGLDWKTRHADQTYDPFYRIGLQDPSEEWLLFFRQFIGAKFNDQTGLLTLEVLSFDREYSAKILEFIINHSERFINDLSLRLAKEHLAFATVEAKTARVNYENQRKLLQDFQQQNRLLDVQSLAEARSMRTSQLEAQIGEEQANLSTLRSRLSSDAPAIRLRQDRLAALKGQLASERKRLVGGDDDENFNVLASRYHALTVDVGIAEEAYKLSVSALEASRIEASKKIRTLVTVVNPNIPDVAVYPRIAYALLTWFIALLLCYGIGWFLIASIKDHRD